MASNGRRRCAGCLTAALFAAYVGSGHALADAGRPKKSDIIGTYAKVALASEQGQAWSRTRRWPDAIRIAIDGDYTTEDATKVAHTRDLIRRVIQRPMPIFFSPLSSEETAKTQVVIAFRRRAKLKRSLSLLRKSFGHGERRLELNTGSPDCMLALQPADGHDLAFAIIGVAVGISEAARAHCVSLKLTQAMGLPGVHPDAPGSVFNKTGRTKQTLLDRALLWLHYHPEMGTGLNATQARRRTIELLNRERLK